MFREASPLQGFIWSSAIIDRHKSVPPSLQKRERSEPKVTFVDNSDGITTKLEVTETVEESTLKGLIENDQEECEHLQKKLPPRKRDWEHVRDVHLQVSGGISQKGAVFRMGEHLYGFETIRDLSFQAADNIDRFFGRKPPGGLLYQSPYHFLHDYIEDYGRGFFKSSLSRSAYDLSEWKKQHLETPSIGSPMSSSEFDLNKMDMVSTKEYPEKVRQDNLLLGQESPYRGLTTVDWGPNRATYSRDDRDVMHWESTSDRISYPSKRPLSSASVLSSSIGASSMVQLPSYVSKNYNGLNDQSPLRTYSSLHSVNSLRPSSNVENFECNQHLVRDYHDASDDGSIFLLSSADVKPIAPMLQPQDSIRSMTSSRHSTAEYLSIDREPDNHGDLRSPISPYSDRYWSHQNTAGDNIRTDELPQKRPPVTDSESYLEKETATISGGTSEQRYD
ncbi:unnamed protein product, partial [Strongylus vulgaris]